MNPKTNHIESPFLVQQEFLFSENLTEGTEEEMYYGTNYVDSPFQNYMGEGDAEYSDLRSEEIANFISELYDEEFNEILHELVQDASELYDRELDTTNYGNPLAKKKYAIQELESSYAPFYRELTGMYDRMIQSAEETEWEQMSDEEIEHWVDKHVDAEFENDMLEHGWWSRTKKRAKRLFKKIGKGIKKGFKAIGNAVKKGGKAIVKGAKWIGKKVKGAFLWALKKLKKAGLKLLKWVLKTAINKLPPEYREYAKLARKALFNKEQAEQMYGEHNQEADPIAELQFEYNLQLAEMIYGGTEGEEELEFEEEFELQSFEGNVQADQTEQFHQARERFAEQISGLREDEDPTPHVEEFVAAALYPIAKTAITIVGRQRVVKFLAKYIAKLIKVFLKGDKFKKIIPLLSYAVTDVGLRLIGLETRPEDQENIAGHAVAGIVEDTVKQVAQLPEHLLGDEELVEGHVLEAFEQAVMSNLPPMLSEETYRKRPFLRESKLRGAWIVTPFKKGKRKKFKKFSKIQKIKLTPHLAKEIKSFGGTSLAEHLTEQMGVEIGEEFEGFVHLYELMPGTDLSDISNTEANMAEMEESGSFSAEQLHPLTPANAGLLMNEPGLGREVEEEYMASRRKTKPGQRVFRIAIPRRKMKQVTNKEGITRAVRLSETNIQLNFAQDKLKISAFISEARAQAISALIRSNTSKEMAVPQLLKLIQTGVKIAFLPSMHRRRKIVHAKVLPGPKSGSALKIFPEDIHESLKDNILAWSTPALKDYFRQNTQEWLKISEDDMDGVTISITMQQVPGFSALKQSLNGKNAPLHKHIFNGKPEIVRIHVKPGYDND